jgi:formamidopyrimidine-DNA glycosylase
MMPELPEVQFTIQSIRPQVCGKKIEKISIIHPKLTRPKPELFIQAAEKQKIVSLSRHGKWIIFHLEAAPAMLLHLRMTGRLTILPAHAPLPNYSVATLGLEGDINLVFSDMRKFGRLYLVEDISDFLKNIGPDALSADFTPASFRSGLLASRQKMKPLLLSQRLVAGLGNIYVDESCFAAGIKPERLANTLSDKEAISLYEHIRRILKAAVTLGGTSFDAVWAGGGYQHQLQVFHRQGQACFRCGSKIEKIKLAGRGTHFCPNCQK